MTEWVPEPPSRRPGDADFGHRMAAWACRLVEPRLIRAVPALAEYPRAAARVAWVTTRAIISARGRDEEDVPLAMSAVVPPNLLTGLLPAENIDMLRAVQLDITDAPPPDVLKSRLEYLAQVGDTLPRHFSRG